MTFNQLRIKSNFLQVHITDEPFHTGPQIAFDNTYRSSRRRRRHRSGGALHSPSSFKTVIATDGFRVGSRHSDCPLPSPPLSLFVAVLRERKVDRPPPKRQVEVKLKWKSVDGGGGGMN